MTRKSPIPTITYAIQNFDDTGNMRAPYLICKGFLSNDWQVRILTIASMNNETIDYAWNSVPVEKVNGWSKKIKILNLAKLLLDRNDKDVVITWVWYWYCFALPIAKWLFNKPYVIVLDTYLYKANSKFWRRLREGIRYGFILNNANIVLAETPDCFAYAQQHLRRPEVLLVPASLWHKDLQMVEMRWIENGTAQKREPAILFAGRITETKNIHHLIEAFAGLLDYYPEWKLQIVGPITSQNYYDFLQRLVCEYGLGDHVQFLHGLYGEELYRHYMKCSVFVLPAEGEGFPSVILEAMYFGGAIVAANSGEVAYQLDGGKCGFLYEPGDIMVLKDSLAQLMASQTQREQYMEKARQRMLELFSWEKNFAQVEQRVKKILA